MEKMGPSQLQRRDYITGDQLYWHNAIIARLGASAEESLTEWFGVYDFCFAGEGITEEYFGKGLIPSRIFLVKNSSLKNLHCSRQNLGTPQAEKVLE
jgi:hypothetical protein